MERLSASDAMFLQLEQPDHRIHFGALYRFGGDAPPIGELTERIGARIGRFGRLRRRIVRVPLGVARPVLVDDAGFDVARHVSRVELPPPGDDDALRSVVGELFSRPLDMGRPAWELLLIDGLAGGGFAIAAKVHHAYADAVSFGTFVIELLSDASHAQEGERSWSPEPAPGRARLLVHALADSVRTPRELARGHRPLPLLRSCTRGVAAAADLIRTNPPAPMSRLNEGPGGAAREVHWLRVSTAELQGMATAIGATLNAVVLSIVAGGLGRYFARHGDEQDGLVALMPISLRAADGDAALGNRVASVFPPLPLREPDPVRRVELVTRGIAELLAAGKAAGVAAIKTIGDVAPPAFMRWLVRRAYTRPDFNVMATTVVFPGEGPTVFGAKLEEVVPCVHISAWHGMGLGMTALGDAAVFGVTTDRARVPDGAAFVADLEAAFGELRDAVAARATEQPDGQAPDAVPAASR